MKSYHYKIFADLRAHRSSSILAVLSIAIGVFLLGTLLGMMDLQLNVMDATHRWARPAHINFILKNDIGENDLQSLRSLPDVAGIDPLSQITTRFKLQGESNWRNVTLQVRPDYRQQQFDLFSLLSGQWPSSQKVALERQSARFTGLSVGEQIILESPLGNRNFEISGLIRHPFVKPPAFGGNLIIFIAAEDAQTFGLPPRQFRQLLVQIKAPYTFEKARAIASDLRQHLNRMAIGVNATLFQDPERHWGHPFISGINLVLTVMAWASLFLSSVLILNTSAALITQQTHQIGIMKAIGASHRRIAGLYFGSIGILAFLALLIALPLSAIAAYYSSRWLLQLFNIALDQFRVSQSAVVCMLISAISMPILAAWYPIRVGIRLPVKAALASYGVGGDFGLSRFDYWLDALLIARLPTRFALSLGNLFRRKARLLWTQLVLIIAGVLFMVIMALIASVNQTLDHELDRSHYTLRLGFRQTQTDQLIERIIRPLPEIRKIEHWNRIPAELFQNQGILTPSGSLGVQMTVLPPDSSLYQPLIVAGRWFNQQDSDERQLVLNAATAELNHLQVGDSIQVSLNGATAESWRILGLYRWFVGNSFAVEPVYALQSAVSKSSAQTAASAYALLDTPVDNLETEHRLLERVTELFQNEHISLDPYTTHAKLEQRQFATNQFRPITSTLLGLAAMIASVGAIGLSGTLAIGALQRTREIGVLRAIGASSRAIFGIFMLEGWFHAALAWLVSLPLAYCLGKPLALKLGEVMLGLELEYCFSAKAPWIWLAIIFIMTGLAAYRPSRAASKVTVRESLNY